MKEATAIGLMKRSYESRLVADARQKRSTDDSVRFMARVVEPFRASVASLLHSPVVSLLGNRLQLLATSTIATALERFTLSQLNDRDMGNITFGIIAAIASLLISNAFLGSNTANTYARTKRHLRKYGKLSENFVKTACQTYCTAQGVYLAARDAGVTEEFRQIAAKNCPIENQLVG